MSAETWLWIVAITLIVSCPVILLAFYAVARAMRQLAERATEQRRRAEAWEKRSRAQWRVLRAVADLWERTNGDEAPAQVFNDFADAMEAIGKYVDLWAENPKW